MRSSCLSTVAFVVVCCIVAKAFAVPSFVTASDANVLLVVHEDLRTPSWNPNNPAQWESKFLALKEDQGYQVALLNVADDQNQSDIATLIQDSLIGASFIVIIGDARRPPIASAECGRTSEVDNWEDWYDLAKTNTATGNFIPNYYNMAEVATAWSSTGQALSANDRGYLGTHDNVYIGRIPAKSIQEIQNYLDKCEEYLAISGTPNWSKKILMTHDDVDGGCNSTPGSQTLPWENLWRTRIPSTYTVETLHSSDRLPRNPFDDTFDENYDPNLLHDYFEIKLSQGCGVLTSFGPCGGVMDLTRWYGGLLKNENGVPIEDGSGHFRYFDDYHFSNQGTYPLLLGASCDIGGFDQWHYGYGTGADGNGYACNDDSTEYQCVAEKLLLLPDAGIIAAIAPTHWTTHTAVGTFGYQFFNQIFDYRNYNFGRLVHAVQDAARDDIMQEFTFNSFILLGDPTLRLPYTANITPNWEHDRFLSEDYRIPPGHELTIEAGVAVYAASGKAIIVEDGGSLIVEGTPGDQVSFTSYGSSWRGVICQKGGTVHLSHAKISRAETGLTLLGDSKATLDTCEIENCTVGIEGGFLANMFLNGTSVNDNSKCGIVLYSASAQLIGSEVSRNGRGEWTLGGISHFYDGSVSLSCTKVNDNVGTGIFMDGGVLNMAVPWGGNEISNNTWPRGQIHIDKAWLNMVGGKNKIVPQKSSDYFIYIEALPTTSPKRSVNGNFWGYTSGGHDADVIGRLRLDYFDFTSFSQLTSWSLCNSPTTPSLSDCETYWKNANTYAKDKDFASAKNEYNSLLAEFSDCYLGSGTVEQIVSSKLQDGETYSNIRSYLDSTAAAAGQDDIVELASKMLSAAIVAILSDDSIDTAQDELTDLINTLSGVDSLNGEAVSRYIDYLSGVSNSESGDVVKACLDTLELTLDTLLNARHGSYVVAPTIAFSDITPIDQTEDTVTFTPSVECSDEVSVDLVYMDYRILPTSSWSRDTLDDIGGNVWSLDVSLGTSGGCIQYRIVAVDDSNRIATWPANGYWANLADTIASIVTFEPRLTTPLTDTAYVYAPGVITDDIEIGDGGVLYVLPAPVALDSYVVAIDSGVGITLSSEGSVAELVVNGADSTVIRLECADAGDRWTGISDLGGVVQVDHAELCGTVRPLYSAKDVGWPYIRLQDVAISDFALPSFLGSTNSGVDTSFVIGCTFEDGDSSGIIIADGSSSLDFEDVTIQNCGDDGLVLANADNQLLKEIRITNNGRYGIFTETGTGNSVRLANCYVAFNGDTLPEIKANSYSSIDVSDYAGNIVKDSTGVLFECAEVNDFDAELGSNSFVLADSTGKYFNVTSMSGPSYITGNTFYPESVNDSTFIDDYMKHDTLSKWVYSYLRADNLMDEVIEDPNGSIDFELKAYVQNYLGTVANDTITQVGFKYRVFPDSTTWTTLRQNTIETDSVYDWTVSVGDQGGLISYIWWAKDKHGRYITSPAGADTTTPDSGATHFLSFEMSDTLISGGDSVTIWAPTTLTHDLRVGDFGKLVIKPWPGASDHTITLSEGVSLYAVSQNAGLGSARLWIQGTESMPITLEAESDTVEWEQFYIFKSEIEATYTTFRSNTVALQSGTMGSNVLKLDHCTFESSSGFFYIEDTDVSTSYIRNCVFRDLGTTWDEGSFLILECDIEITDSWFYNNSGNGIVLYNPYATEISGCNSIANEWSGLQSSGITSSVTVNCSEFSYNGGDSTSEIYLWDGVIDFSDDAGNVFADKGGTLLEGPTMASFDLDDGGNGFYLFDSTGHYIVTGDNTDTLDASGNLWFPFTPDTSIFQDYFDPDTSRYWDWASPTASLAECGVGGMSSMPGDGPIALIRPTASTYSVPSHGGGNSKSAYASKSVGKLFGSKSANSVAYDEAVVAQKNRQYAEAKSRFASFIIQNSDHPKTEAALSRFMVSAKKSGQTEGLVDFFARQEVSSVNPRVKRAAKFLKLNAMVMDGRSQEALDAYDDILHNPESRHDSITAAICATRVLFNNQTSRMSTLHPENMPENFTDMCRRIMRLIASERRTNPALGENPAAPVVPTSYALYQNYPNPFNPSTDIRFDLPEAVRVELKIFNILGQEVVTLVDDVRAAGAYRVLWDGKNAAGLNVASGVYVYQIKTGNFQDAKKMMLIR